MKETIKTKEKSLGNKVLNSAKKIASYFPLINGYNLLRKTIKEDVSWDVLFRIFLAAFYVGTLINYNNTSSLNPAKWDKYYETEEKKQQAKQNYIQKIDLIYNSLFKDAKTFDDSLEIYQKYGLPIKLIPANFEQKEKVVKQNKLEDSLK